MKNKNLYIGLGVLAVAGVAFYMWKKKQGESSETETAGASEEKASATGRFGRVSPRFSPRVAPVIAGKTIGQSDSSHGNKCYCGQDDSTPKKDVWNVACCDKATI